MKDKNVLLLLSLLLLSCVDNEVEPNHLALSNSEPVPTTLAVSAPSSLSSTSASSMLSSSSPSSLCQEAEIAVVSCQVDEPQARLLSICYTEQAQQVHYRIGTANEIELTKTFTPHQPLLRWVDSSAYTTYFGFKDNDHYYSVGVPQETYGAKVFVDVFDEEGQASSHLACTDNSFADKMLASTAIIDLSDDDIYKQGTKFPYDQLPKVEHEN